MRPAAPRGIQLYSVRDDLGAARLGGALAHHVLDTMSAIGESVERAAPVRTESTVPPVPPIPLHRDPTTRTYETTEHK